MEEGLTVGELDGMLVGKLDGEYDGWRVGGCDGAKVGAEDGLEGNCVGDDVGEVGVMLGDAGGVSSDI